MRLVDVILRILGSDAADVCRTVEIAQLAQRGTTGNFAVASENCGQMVVRVLGALGIAAKPSIDATSSQLTVTVFGRKD